MEHGDERGEEIFSTSCLVVNSSLFLDMGTKLRPLLRKKLRPLRLKVVGFLEL